MTIYQYTFYHNSQTSEYYSQIKQYENPSKPDDSTRK